MINTVLDRNSLRCFILHNWDSLLFELQPLISPSTYFLKTTMLIFSKSFDFFRYLIQVESTIFILLWFCYFTKQNILKFHPSCIMWQDLLLFFDGIIVHCVSISHFFFDSFIHCWTFGFFRTRASLHRWYYESLHLKLPF